MEKDCVFCDRTKIEERIIYENKGFYVIATLGQITDGGYVLLVPKKHIACAGAFTDRQTTEMLKLNFKICEAISLEYQHSAHSAPYPVTVFEHGILGQTVKHAHLHFLPAVLDFTSKIKRDFPTAEMEELKCAAHIQYLYYERKEPYLFWSAGFPQGSELMVCWNPPVPSQYLRVVAAEFLGRPERADWRNMDTELDKKLWMETVIRLKKYFL